MKHEYRVAARAALLTLALTVAVALNTTAFAQAPPGSLWYNGDFNDVNGLANERNTAITYAAVYDDFDVTAPLGWNVTAVFSDNLASTIVTGADWEIRIGVSEGNGGTFGRQRHHELPASYSYWPQWVRFYRIYGRGHRSERFSAYAALRSTLLA
jgi:hypothetical protein